MSHFGCRLVWKVYVLRPTEMGVLADLIQTSAV